MLVSSYRLDSKQTKTSSIPLINKISMEYNYFEGRPNDALAEHNLRVNHQIHQRFRTRDGNNPLDLSVPEFVKLYRVPQHAVVDLTNELRHVVRQRRSPQHLPLLSKVLIALGFYACGSYQRMLGRSIDMAVSQTTVSRCVREITEALNHDDILNEYIKFPLTREERAPIIQRNELLGLPRVLGFMDGFLLRLSYLPHNVERQSFFCRKGYTALNNQIICDADLNILNVDARFPGSLTDNQVWNASSARQVVEEAYWEDRCWLLATMRQKNLMKSIFEGLFKAYLEDTASPFMKHLKLCNLKRVLFASKNFVVDKIIKNYVSRLQTAYSRVYSSLSEKATTVIMGEAITGDSGYFTAPWLHIPLIHAEPGTPEFEYTRLHCRARNAVERCIGVLKGRFRLLSIDRCVNYKDATYAGEMVNACCVLHNFCRRRNIADPPPVMEPEGNNYPRPDEFNELPLHINLQERGRREMEFLINYANDRRVHRGNIIHAVY